jgi:hypothetical protein
MQRFLNAVLEKDATALVMHFPAAGTWALSVTAEGGGRRATHFTSKQLKVGLREGGDFRDVIFGDDGDDSLRSIVLMTKGTRWRMSDAYTFVPPSEAADPPIFVKWRLDDGRPVIQEIGFPF